MDVTKNITDPGPVEMDHARSACFIESQVETLPFKQRKNIVEEGIAIGKLDRGTGGHHQQVRLKALVPLRQSKRSRRITRNGRRLARDWCQPYDGAGQGSMHLGSALDLNAPTHDGDLRTQCGHAEARRENSGSDSLAGPDAAFLRP